MLECRQVNNMQDNLYGYLSTSYRHLNLLFTHIDDCLWAFLEILRFNLQNVDFLSIFGCFSPFHSLCEWAEYLEYRPGCQYNQWSYQGICLSKSLWGIRLYGSAICSASYG